MKTHCAGKVIDASGDTVLQYDYHGGDNQLWLILPADQPLSQVNPTQQQPQTQGTSFTWANDLSNVIHKFGSHGPHVPHVPNIIPGQGFGNIPIPFSFEPHSLIQSHTHTAAVFKPFQNYIIYAVHSDGQKALDVSQASTSFGNLILYSFHGSPNQRFIFEQEGNLYRIKSLSNGKYVRVTNDDEHDCMWIRTDEKGSKS